MRLSEHPFMMRFIFLFVLFGVFLMSFASWAGQGNGVGPQLAAWGQFNNLMSSGPGPFQPMEKPRAPGDTPALPDAYSVALVQNFSTAGCTQVGGQMGPIPGNTYEPNELSNLEPQQATNYTLIPWNGVPNGQNAAMMNWAYWTQGTQGWWDSTTIKYDKGDWLVTAYFRGNSTTSVYTIGMILESVNAWAGTPSCGHDQTIMVYSTQVQLISTSQIRQVFWHVKLDKDMVLALNGGIWLNIIALNAKYQGNNTVSNELISLYSDPTHMMKVNAPPARSTADTCNDIFCAIKQSISTFLQLGVYALLMVVWVSFVVMSAIVWFF